jgi:uncharacterized Zn finger protein
VVASNKLDAARISEFETCQQGDCFNAEESPVNVITCGNMSVSSGERAARRTKEKIVGVWSVAPDAEDFYQVVELA